MTDFVRIATPLGTLVAAAEGGAVVGLWFEGQRHFAGVGADWREGLDSPVLAECARQLGEYFGGRRTRFELPLAPKGTAFQIRVWNQIAAIPFGATITYSELARRCGKASAARAAGAATGRNPISIVVPCHRVVGSAGALTGYAGGVERKRRLLALEGIGGG